MQRDRILVNKIHNLGLIYTDKKSQGDLYIDGVFICNLPYLGYGYDINSTILKDLDVKNKDKVLKATSKLWRYSGCMFDILNLLKEGLCDIKYIADVNYNVKTFKDYEREIDINLMLKGLL